MTPIIRELVQIRPIQIPHPNSNIAYKHYKYDVSRRFVTLSAFFLREFRCSRTTSP